MAATVKLQFVVICACLAVASGAIAQTKLPAKVSQLPKPNLVPAPSKKLLNSKSTRKARKLYWAALGQYRRRAYVQDDAWRSLWVTPIFWAVNALSPPDPSTPSNHKPTPEWHEKGGAGCARSPGQTRRRDTQ